MSVSASRVWGVLAGITACVALVGPYADAASQGTVVAATVPSATNLDVDSQCATATPDVTDFGVTLPDGQYVTGQDCIVTFGSSNDTAMLMAYQPDGLGVAMASVPDGSLEPDFAGDGVIEQDLTPGNDWYEAVTAHGETGILVGGRDDDASDLEVARYLLDGTLDPLFGAAGVLRIPGHDVARDVGVDAAGRIYIGAHDGADSVVHRRLADGTADGAWASGGTATVDAGGVDQVLDVHPLDDGRLIVSSATPKSVFALTADGLLDTTWGGGDGLVAFSAGGQLYQTAVAPDGSTYGVFDDGSDLVVQRITPAGVLDATFAGTGTLTVDFGGTDRARAVTAQDDGLIVAGAWEVSCADTCVYQHLARFDETGTLDPGFGTAGTVTGPSQGYAALPGIEALVELVVAGSGHVYGVGVDVGVGADAALVRYTSAGAVDVAFGTSGRAAVQGAQVADLAFDAAQVHDGRIAVVGSNGPSGSFNALLGLLDVSEVDDWGLGVTDWDDGASTFGACLDSIEAATTAAAWTVDPDTCTASDSDPWRAIPKTAGSAGAKVAETLGSAETGARVNIRFGLRPATTQPPGSYAAPLRFEVVAPSV